MNHATTTPRTRRVGAARNQQRIVEAARELFAARGLDITLDEVAERAGVGVGTVYRRFADKRELVAEVEQAEAAKPGPRPIRRRWPPRVDSPRFFPIGRTLPLELDA